MTDPTQEPTRERPRHPYGVGASWLERARDRRAERALARQLGYQRAKVQSFAGREQEIMAWMQDRSRRIRERLESVRPIPQDARALEVGSGSHGLIFFFDAGVGTGVDPLAREYALLFPEWQRGTSLVTAVGESLPFADGTFQVVLCDNVVDHARAPRAIIDELVRVLAPGGLLYFTVNVHHPIYALASALHGTWNALRISIEIGPFADHTVHLTPRAAERLFRDQPLRVASMLVDMEEARAATRAAPRHLGDRLKRPFFKNAGFELIAIRRDRGNSGTASMTRV